jgi:hypothetical protein
LSSFPYCHHLNYRSIERFVAVRFPMKAKFICNKKSTFIAIVTIYLVTIILFLPFPFKYKIVYKIVWQRLFIAPGNMQIRNVNETTSNIIVIFRCSFDWDTLIFRVLSDFHFFLVLQILNIIIVFRQNINKIGINRNIKFIVIPYNFLFAYYQGR